MNAWQRTFCVWNSQRLGITLAESAARFERSMAAFDGAYADRVHDALAVFAGDAATEVFDAYQVHALPHFLRMLSYPECEREWAPDHPVLRALTGRAHVSVLDFGCGLAQTSITLARALRGQGARVSLFLVDVPTLRAEFLVWMTGAVFLPCTRGQVAPPLPPADVIVATEVLEHLHDPRAAFEALDAALLPGGFLITSVGDHAAEFLHVSPDLSPIRAALAAGGYVELERHTLYRKPCDPA